MADGAARYRIPQMFGPVHRPSASRNLENEPESGRQPTYLVPMPATLRGNPKTADVAPFVDIHVSHAVFTRFSLRPQRNRTRHAHD